MWYTLCANPQAIEQLYTIPPTLNTVELHELSMLRDGPQMQLRLELPTFPDRPPPKWPSKANVVQMTLDVWGVTELELAGWGTTNRGVLLLTQRENDMLRFTFTSATLRLSGQCIAMRISHFSPYMKKEE
jgi:hypothetical protein